jgi:RNA polymerase sigma-70 factor (ECF subfamily)
VVRGAGCGCRERPAISAALGSFAALTDPLYAYIRRFRHSPHDAQDLTQEFFARLLAGAYLERADREKGRFRTFLLTALKRFMVNEWDRARAQKRGGGQQALPLDGELAERLCATGPAAEASPEKVYDHHCAVTLLNTALEALQQEFTVTGRAEEFEAMKPYLTAPRGEISYEALAARLNRDAGAARVAVHRFRKRYRQLFREQVARTVARPEDAEDEMRYLLTAVRG